MLWFLLMILLIILLLGLLYMICLLPQIPSRPDGRRMDVLYAHRGLWDDETPENTIPAIRRAVRHGFGVTLDVRPRQDGELMVFHDESLERMCGIRKPLSRCSAHDLHDVRLGRSECTIPSLADALQEIDGKVPLMVEIMPCSDAESVCRQADALLKNYPGLYSVASFDARVLHWYRRNRPEVYRGQLTKGIPAPLRRNFSWRALLSSSLVQNILSRPDFIAYDPVTSPAFPLRLVRMFHPAMAAWNVRSQDALNSVLASSDTAFFDGFLPTPPDGESSANPDQLPD